MNIDQYVFWNGDYMRFGIGTETPNATLLATGNAANQPIFKRPSHICCDLFYQIRIVS